MALEFPRYHSNWIISYLSLVTFHILVFIFLKISISMWYFLTIEVTLFVLLTLPTLPHYSSCSPGLSYISHPNCSVYSTFTLLSQIYLLTFQTFLRQSFSHLTPPTLITPRSKHPPNRSHCSTHTSWSTCSSVNYYHFVPLLFIDFKMAS